jgi:hypothetical protein
MSNSDIEKLDLYNSVKTLVECDAEHMHLPQAKLYTLFSIGFQYMLFRASKVPGNYIIRVEDSYLMEKLIRKAKDDITRKMMQKISLPRKLKFERSLFHLDFFNIGSWQTTNEIPKEKIQGALIIKNTNSLPPEFNEDEEDPMKDLPKDISITALTDSLPKTITIAYNQEYAGLTKIMFPFIKEENDVVKGVTVNADINLNSIED